MNDMQKAALSGLLEAHNAEESDIREVSDPDTQNIVWVSFYSPLGDSKVQYMLMPDGEVDS